MRGAEGERQADGTTHSGRNQERSARVVVVLRRVHHVLEVALLATRRFLDLAIGSPQYARRQRPWLREDGGVVRCGLILDGVADPPQPLDYSQGCRVKGAVVRQPRLVRDVD